MITLNHIAKPLKHANEWDKVRSASQLFTILDTSTSLILHDVPLTLLKEKWLVGLVFVETWFVWDLDWIQNLTTGVACQWPALVLFLLKTFQICVEIPSNDGSFLINFFFCFFVGLTIWEWTYRHNAYCVLQARLSIMSVRVNRRYIWDVVLSSSLRFLSHKLEGISPLFKNPSSVILLTVVLKSSYIDQPSVFVKGCLLTRNKNWRCPI